MDSLTKDILFQAASTWKKLTEYKYIFTYGYKGKLHKISLHFSPEDFPHLAGFQYINDISLPRYNPPKIMDKILTGKITITMIKKASTYKQLIEPRLQALIHLDHILDSNFTLFSYMPQMYPFTTKIKADYLISSHQNNFSFVFIIQETPNGNAKCDYLCCSAFVKGSRNYETNQRTRSILKKERIHISSNVSSILYDRLSNQENGTTSPFIF